MRRNDGYILRLVRQEKEKEQGMKQVTEKLQTYWVRNNDLHTHKVRDNPKRVVMLCLYESLVESMKYAAEHNTNWQRKYEDQLLSTAALESKLQALIDAGEEYLGSNGHEEDGMTFEAAIAKAKE